MKHWMIFIRNRFILPEIVPKGKKQENDYFKSK